MELFYAYFAGLLTLINPCVLPVLPLVIGSAAQGGARGPLVLAAGMSVSFVALGMFAATVGYSFGLDEARIAQVGAVAMIGFGLILLTPALSDRFELVTAGFAARADAGIEVQDRSHLSGQFLSGALLGAVWSPCVGPVLGGAIALAYQGETLLRAGAIMLAFALGTSTIVLALAYGTRQAIAARLGGAALGTVTLPLSSRLGVEARVVAGWVEGPWSDIGLALVLQ